jgi:NitT/TauT family transport system ATP-binding protein
MNKVEIVSCSRSYKDAKGDEQTVLDSVDLMVAEGEFLCIVGSSGCGKTTLLNMIAGFDKPTGGSILIDGEAVKGPSPKSIKIFQEHALLPWRTALTNVCLGLDAKGMGGVEAKRVAMEYLDLVGLADAAHKFPYQLSGGMRQRVAIARALAVKPDILLMDETFGALDTLTRYRLQDEILRIWRERKPTVIFVTHDIDEALYLADRIVVMTANPGKISYIYEQPEGSLHRRGGHMFENIKTEILSAFHCVYKIGDGVEAPPVGL